MKEDFLSALKMGISFGHGLTPTEIVQGAVRCEEHRFDSVFVSESTGVDALSVLGGIAVRTKRLNLVSGIVNVYSRSAVQIAMAAATVQELSRGRFTLGLGASSKAVVSNWHGLEHSNHIQKTSETIDTIRSKLGSSGNNSSAQIPFLVGTKFPKIPIILATIGEKMLGLAREKCDGALFFLRPVSKIREEAAKNLGQFAIHASVVTCVSSDQKVAEKRVRNTLAFYLTYGHFYRKFIEKYAETHLDSGLIESIRISWLRGKREEASSLLPQELVEELAIYGTPPECRRKIESEFLNIIGLETLSFQFNPGEKEFSESLDMLSNLFEA